ncbi:MAG TPA: hypothetical protein VK639_04560 [Terriglobales bacterium]|nr:hypothetical protein [Terriglobales bacterium]
MKAIVMVVMAMSISSFTWAVSHADAKNDRRVHSKPSESRAKDGGQEMSFEVMRMLSTGMTKGEVISHAGPPRHMFKRARAATWVYLTADHWIVELTFGGDRVLNINWSRA